MIRFGQHQLSAARSCYEIHHDSLRRERPGRPLGALTISACNSNGLQEAKGDLYKPSTSTQCDSAQPKTHRQPSPGCVTRKDHDAFSCVTFLPERWSTTQNVFRQIQDGVTNVPSICAIECVTMRAAKLASALGEVTIVTGAAWRVLLRAASRSPTSYPPTQSQ